MSDRLPPHWFYTGGPFIELDRWGDLEAALVAVLEDPAALNRAHARALAWLRERRSEAAVGRFLAERLNHVSVDHVATRSARGRAEAAC